MYLIPTAHAHTSTGYEAEVIFSVKVTISDGVFPFVFIIVTTDNIKNENENCSDFPVHFLVVIAIHVSPCTLCMYAYMW